jgi:hypothetical protein
MRESQIMMDLMMFLFFFLCLASVVNKEEILGGGVGDKAAIGKELMMEDAFGRGQLDIVGGFKRHKADKLTETHQRQPPASSRIPAETHTHTHEQDTDTSSMFAHAPLS